MTARKRNPLHPELFPRLAEFAAGYLHQDFTLDHETPEQALRAFFDDANADERQALREELTRFREAASEATWADAREAFEALGGAWRPRSRAALEALLHLPDTLAGAVKKGRRS